MSVLLFPLKLLLLTLDFVLMALTFGWVKALKKLLAAEPLRSVPVADDESCRVHPDYKGALATQPRPGVDTLYDITKGAVDRYGPNKCMGTREFLGQKSPKVKHFGGIKWLNYSEMGEQAHKFGAALAASGVVAAPTTTTLDKIKTPCSIAIFENTCSEWMIAAQGAFSQSAIVVTVYATLGMDAVIDAVNEGSISAIVCNKINVGKLVEHCKEMKSLKTIIYTSDLIAPDAKIEVPKDLPKGVQVISFEDFVASGDIAKFPARPPTKDTTAVIMYTSGSTAKPKGVVIKHSAIVAAVASGEIMLNVEHGKDVYLGYLPLAHILELMAEFSFLATGCTVCYADPKTLTATGAYPIGALEQFSPTMMAGVPKIWDVIKKGVEAKVSKSPPIARFLVETAFQARTFAINHGYDTPLFKALVFKKFSKVVGGRLRLALSGGGPLNDEVQIFIRTCFGCPLFQGYGLTETCAGLTIQDPLDLRGGIAGQPIPSCEVKLESCPDITDKGGLPYLKTDTKDVEGNAVFGRGEVMVRGPSMSSGYYMMPDKTAEEWEKDGFFHTGDVGQFMADGSLRIVDRKKNLVKLKGGEYVALEKMEMTYGNSKFVDAVAGGICCYGDGEMDRPIALMQLNPVTTMEWAGQNKIDGDFEKVKGSPELMAAVMADMKGEAKKGGLSYIEVIKAVVFLAEPWTPENGCLTAANKLQRRKVVEVHEKEFEEVRKKGIH